MKTKNKVNLESLFSQENSDGGEWLKINIPKSNGASIELKVLGSDSFVYRSKLAEMNRAELTRPDLKDEEYNSEKETRRRHILKCELLNILVVDWRGMEQEFTKELSLRLLINAPFVLLEVDKFAADRTNFMKPLV